MKKWIVLCLAVLTGCAGSGPDRHIDSLRRPDYIRTERTLEMTFPEIQMALFRHEKTCGNAPVFEMEEGQTSFATISEADAAQRPWNDHILFDLMWLQPSVRYETRTRVQVYGFYSNAEVRARIARVFDAILNPEHCTAA